jgi:hypothetical protein
MLLGKHKQHLVRFRIPDELLKAARIESVTDGEAREKLGIHGRERDDLSGILFPYISPVDGERKGARVRLDAKASSDEAKYLLEASCKHLFFPPDVKNMLGDRSIPLVFVEAEKSALAVFAHGQRSGRKLLSIGIGGCWGWRRSDGKVLTPSGGAKATSGPSPDFDLLKFENRTAVLAFDSNAISNKKVQAARGTLARELISRGADVLIVDIPEYEGINGPDDFIAGYGDTDFLKLLVEAKQYKATILALADMPEGVLDGRLGEICRTHMLNRFPVAYAWPALVTVASALVPRRGEQRLNLYTALSGPVGSGKTQAINAAKQLLGIDEPILMSVMAGSAESLMKYMDDANGAARLFSPDELSHMLEKASIQNASFASVISRAWSDKKFTILMAGKAKATFNASLSILGGLVDDRFEDLFSRATTAGLYDRFAFGAFPGAFEFDYYPFEIGTQSYEPDEVFVAPEVWKEKSLWRKEISSRVTEIAIRVAIVCAAFDGRTLLTIKELGPAFEFAKYQQRIRKTLRPNEGENYEAKAALKILAYLDRYDGEFVSKRKLLDETGAYRFGPSTVKRTLEVLESNGDLEVTKNRPFMIRKLNMNGDGK